MKEELAKATSADSTATSDEVKIIQDKIKSLQERRKLLEELITNSAADLLKLSPLVFCFDNFDETVPETIPVVETRFCCRAVFQIFSLHATFSHF